MMRWWGSGLVVAAIGCGGRSDGAIDALGGADAAVDGPACTPRTAPAPVVPAPIDVLVAVDTSGSMDDEVAEVIANANAFASTFAGPKVDLRVTLIASPTTCFPAPLGTGACPGDENLPGYRHVEQTIGSNDALDAILSTAAQWQPALRDYWPPAVIVVTDDDADLSATAFRSAFEGLGLHLVGFEVLAIAADAPPDCIGCQLACGSCTNACCNQASGQCEPLAASEGTVYKQLATMTGGLFRDQCAQDFDGYFDDFAAAIRARTPSTCRYPIPPDPGGGAIDPARIDVSYGPGTPTTPIAHIVAAADCFAGGWYFDTDFEGGATPTEIILCGNACLAVEEDPANVLFVEYGCPRA